MTYLTPASTIENTNLSVRSSNALHRVGIHTVADLLAYDHKQIPEIRNLGAKSIDEIFTLLDDIASGTINYLLTPENKEYVENANEKQYSLFRDADGLLRKDIPLEMLSGLSIRSYNCLKNAGYIYASQLIGIEEETLLSIKNLGHKSVKEILAILEVIHFDDNPNNLSTADENIPCKTFVVEISKHLCTHGGKLYEELLPVFLRAAEDGIAVDTADLYTTNYLRDAVKQEILNFLSKSAFGVEVEELAVLFPPELMSRDIMASIIDEMEADELISLGKKIECRRMTVLEYAESIPKKNEREVFQKRLQGQTLEEIGSSMGITRERVRQIAAKVIRQKNKTTTLVEDRYIELFSKYFFTQDEFTLAFGEDRIVYNYLTLACEKRGSLPINDLLTDESFSVEIRYSAERIVYKNYITIGGERIYKSRQEIVDYVIRTYFQDEASFDDFTAYYNMILEDLGISSEPAFVLNSRTYENKFGDYEKILWKTGRRFRYYDMESYDFFELWQGLALEQYDNAEYSTLKFFNSNLELMHRYDIRDEYELHNLLKKLCKKDETKSINFGRMPMIEFGKPDRDGQVLDMLIRLAPITISDFSAAYEAEYGVLSATFMANFLKNFDEYFYNGVYDISMPQLSTEQFARMKCVLTEDYYEIADAKRIYQREYPKETVENINPYTLKTLGFNVFASYIVKNTYPTASEYFRALLTRDDIVDVRDFPLGVTGKVSYTSELTTLKSKYEIIEYEPFRYINIRRLNEAGITKAQLEAYCDAVAQFVEMEEHFTVTSLRMDGFEHVLEDLGFSEVFYSSLLSENEKRFSYQRMGGTKVFRRSRKDITLKSLLASIVGRETAIDIYDLTELLQSRYGLKIDRYKIVEAVKYSSMYYDKIMEKVYIDYDTYFEEV